MTDPCDVCGGKVIEERPDALDGLTVRVCQNEDCALEDVHDALTNERLSRENEGLP